MKTANETQSIALNYEDLTWTETIPGSYQADYLLMSLEVEIGIKRSWTVYDVRGDVWLEGSCGDLSDGKVKAFNALKAEIS